MPLNKLDNFIKNIEGRILYVNPNDIDATDSVTNQGNSLAQPFKTIQRALLEAARFSYVKGNDNDLVEKTTILLFPGEHVIDNRPGYAIYAYSSSEARAVSRSGGAGVLASSVLTLDLDSKFDLSVEDNILYKFNSFYGGVIVPRGTSIVGLDLRKTKLRPKYVPNPTDPAVENSAIFRITGACYFWQFSFFDGNPSGLVYTNPDDFTATYQATPNFSHHKLTAFEYADGVNKVRDYALTDLDMYYSKVSNAFNSYRDIDQKFPANPNGFSKQRSEWEIVGAFAPDPINISSVISGDGNTPSIVVTVTTTEPHGLNVGTPIKIKGVGTALQNNSDKYNISTIVATVDPTDLKKFTYVLPTLPANLFASPTTSGATVTIETDTVGGASPYVFNCSLRSVWGMNGMHADGSKASGFRSMVVAQFTGVSLQKDDRAFVKYDKVNRVYDSITYSTVNGPDISDQASSTNSLKVYHLDPDAVYRQGWETSHIKASNDSFIQAVSIFAIGYTKHFDSKNGGDISITNSNSNFGQLSLTSDGFRDAAFGKDDNGFITSIIPPRSISTVEQEIEWLSLDVGLTTSVGISSHLYLYGYSSVDAPPTAITQGYRIGARFNDKLYVKSGAGTSEASILMCDNEISTTGFTTALGGISSRKSYRVTSGPSSNSFTIGSNSLLTGEKVKIVSDDGNLPENIEPHITYYVISNGDNNTVKLASSFTDALQGLAITIYGGTNLNILSRVSEKNPGELGSPIQYDADHSNWFVHTNANSSIYSSFATRGTALYGESTELSFVKRQVDERSLDEKLYKFRVFIPKQLSNAKTPENGFVIQESNDTGLLTDSYFTATSIGSSEYQYKRNPRFISTCSVSSGTVTVITELPHNLQAGDTVVIKNVKSDNNTVGTANSGYNGKFIVSGISSAHSFTYPATDVFGKVRDPGTFTSDINSRTTSLPRYERNNLQNNFYVYRNEVISPYIYNQQDGIYHLYILNSGNTIDNEFTSLKFSQIVTDLYPQLDRDNPDANPPAAKSYAKRSPIGEVVTNDLKKSITRETTDGFLKTLGIGISISAVSSSTNSATITFPVYHGLSGIVTGSITAGASYLPTSGIQTYYNVKLLNGSQTGTWNGATANVTVNNGSVNLVNIVSPGAGYTASSLYYDQTRIGAGDGAARFVITNSGITTNIGDYIQVTGIGTTSDGYYRITSVPSATSISIAKTSGDPTIQSGQYALVAGPSSRIASSTYNSIVGITTFTTSNPHGLVVGNQFRLVSAQNNVLGDFVVSQRVGVNTFAAVTNVGFGSTVGAGIGTNGGYIFKHALSSNDGTSDKRAENIAVRQIPFYDSQSFTLSAKVTTGTTLTLSNTGIGTQQRLPLGSYVQIDNEMMRIIQVNNANTVTVARAALGTRQESHDEGSLVRKIKPIAIELRRPSILRASGHTFEYLGYGPGNYSTSLPQVQVKTLTDKETFLSHSQERSGGVVVYTGMSNNGDVYNGNTKTSANSGEVITFDIPKPTITGEDESKLSSVFDEVTIKERLLVEGGASGTVLSQFDGPVTFNSEVRFNDNLTFTDNVRLTSTLPSTSPTTGALVVAGGIGAYNIYANSGNFTSIVVSNTANFQNNLLVNGVSIQSFITGRALIFGV